MSREASKILYSQKLNKDSLPVLIAIKNVLGEIDQGELENKFESKDWCVFKTMILKHINL